MNTIHVIEGEYAGNKVVNESFTYVSGPTQGINSMFVTVHGAPYGKDRNIRIKIADPSQIIRDAAPAPMQTAQAAILAQPEETDEEIIDRIRRKFNILDIMTEAAFEAKVKGMIVTGPPGVGKSHGIEQMLLESQDPCQDDEDYDGPRRAFVKGAASPIGLYQMLYDFRNEGSVLVLDDSDSILYDEMSLNLLKGVLDSKEHRIISWNKESQILRDNQVPREFEFRGAIVFITNLDFENTRGKIGDHLEAIMSRCHYLDMSITTLREKFLRCKQVVQDGMLDRYDFDAELKAEILEYVDVNKHALRELSLRTVVKIADLVNINAEHWKDLADNLVKR